jgi:acyl-CoA dehydrogenase
MDAMNVPISAEHRLLVETARKFVETELMPLEASVEETGLLSVDVASEITRKAKEAGLFASNIPAEFGGAGLSAFESALIEEEFGATTDVLIRRSLGCVYEVLLTGTDEQKDIWLKPSVQGERIFAVAFTEPEAGSDAAGIKTRAVREGDGWILNGAKTYISDADFSDFFVVSVVTDPSAGSRGISLFLVNKTDEGFRLGRRQYMMGNRGTGTYELFFDDVRLPANRLLGAEGAGLKLTLSLLGRVRLMQIGARTVGRMSRMLRLMTDYARERRQFGKPIGDFQMVQQMLADTAMDVATTRLMVRNTAMMMDAGQDLRTHLSMVKVVSSEALGRVADRAVQMFGGAGYSKDLEIERFYRDARIFRIFDGTSEIHRGVIAKNLLKDGCDMLDSIA